MRLRCLAFCAWTLSLIGCGRFGYEPLAVNDDGAVVADAARDGLVDAPPTVCSTSGAATANLTVKNNFANVTVALYWVDYGCVEQPYPTVAPLTTYVQSTYVTHPWRLRNSQTGELLADIPPLTGDTTVVVP